MLNDRELALILAALRHWQASTDSSGLTQDTLVEIATNGGKFEALGPDAIDNLCQRLNTGEPEVLDTPFVAMCRRVAETAANWADCSDWREARAVFQELGADCRRLLGSVPEDQPVRRYVLYDFDADELATSNVYGSYAAAREDADELNNVLILPLAGAGWLPTEPLSADDSGEPCACEQPGPFNCGVPGTLAHLENGRLAPGAKAERCDECQRYPSDAAALARLQELGLA